MTNSRDVAAFFGKQHKNVLQSLDGLECSAEFNRLNFQPVEYRDAKGESRRSFNMTKDGFVFLVMGFTGSKAAAFKEAGRQPPLSRDTVRPPAAVRPPPATCLPSDPERPS